MHTGPGRSEPSSYGYIVVQRLSMRYMHSAPLILSTYLFRELVIPKNSSLHETPPPSSPTSSMTMGPDYWPQGLRLNPERTHLLGFGCSPLSRTHPRQVAAGSRWRYLATKWRGDQLRWLSQILFT